MSTLNRADGAAAGVPAGGSPRHRKTNPLWWFVLAAFGLQLAAWTVWMVIASHHPVAEVPLETPHGR